MIERENNRTPLEIVPLPFCLHSSRGGNTFAQANIVKQADDNLDALMVTLGVPLKQLDQGAQHGNVRPSDITSAVDTFNNLIRAQEIQKRERVRLQYRRGQELD
jgi:hypothetical protein